MKKIVSTFIALAIASVIGISSVNAQSYGTRVEANIPFDFTVGKKTFKAGEYGLSIIRNNSGFYSVTLRDEDGKAIFYTNAMRSGRVTRDGSQMVFAVVNGERYLETIKTPELGYSFSTSIKDKSLAVVRIAVPVTDGPN